MFQKINTIINNFKEKHPFIFTILIFVFGTIVGAIINHYIENTFWDTEPPYIENVYPSSRSYLNEIPEYIIVNFIENGGSGIDKDNSRIKLIGAKSGVIKGIINFTKDNMSLKPETELLPDAYTIEIKLADRVNPPIKYTYGFHIYSEPILSITSAGKFIEYLEKHYVNNSFQGFVFTESHDMYELSIANNNDEVITNINFNIQLIGIVKNPIKFNKKGITNWEFIPGLTGYIIPGVSDLNYCSLRMEINEMASGGSVSALIITDSNISNYTNPLWCYSEDITNNLIENGIYGIYNGSYEYSEYGQRKIKSVSGYFYGEKGRGSKRIFNENK